MSKVTQRQSVTYTGTHQLLQYYLNQLSGDVELVETRDTKALRVFKAVNVSMEHQMVVVEVSNSFFYLVK